MHCVLIYMSDAANHATGNIDHYSDVIMSAMASSITSVTSVYSTVYSDTDQRKHQRYASLALVRWIHRWPVSSPHKGPVTRENVSIWWRHHVVGGHVSYPTYNLTATRLRLWSSLLNLPQNPSDPDTEAISGRRWSTIEVPLLNSQPYHWYMRTANQTGHIIGL